MKSLLPERLLDARAGQSLTLQIHLEVSQLTEEAAVGLDLNNAILYFSPSIPKERQSTVKLHSVVCHEIGQNQCRAPADAGHAVYQYVRQRDIFCNEMAAPFKELC